MHFTAKWVCSRRRHVYMKPVCHFPLRCGSKPPMSNRITCTWQGSKFLRSACPHLGIAVAPLQGLCPLEISCVAHRFCSVVSVLVAFLYPRAIDWRTSNCNIDLVVVCLGDSGRLELGPDDVGGQFMGIVSRPLG